MDGDEGALASTSEADGHRSELRAMARARAEDRSLEERVYGRCADLRDGAEDRAKVLEQLAAPGADREALEAKLRELNAERRHEAADLYALRAEVVDVLAFIDEAIQQFVVDELTSEVERLEAKTDSDT